MPARLYSVLFILVFAGSGWAQFSHDPQMNAPYSSPFSQNENSISVSVQTDHNEPVADARVEVRNEEGQVVATAYTNSLGVARLTAGDGVVEVEATKGVEEARDRIEAGFGSSVVLRIRTADGNGAGDANTVSVAEYKVPGKARNELKKANDCISKREIAEAQKHIDKALELYPHFAEALTLRGILKLDANDSEGALDDIHEALKLDPSYATAYIAAGAAYNRLGKYDEASLSLDRGVALSPTSWQGYFELGKTKIGKMDYAGAIRMLDKAESLVPDRYPLIHLVKAHALLALKDYTNAVTELQAFLQKSPDAPQASQARNILDQTKAFVAAQK